MFLHKNKKEIEYNRTRSVSRKEEGFKILRKIYKIAFYFLALSFFGIVLYCLLFSSFLFIEEIELNGLENLKKDEVLAVAERVYGGKYAGIFPKKNLLVFPLDKTEESLKENFKRIRDIEILKKFPNKVSISIKERESLLLWCNNQQECFIVDESGYAYSKVALDSKEVVENNLIKIVSGEENRSISEGEKILDSEKISFFLESKDAFLRNSKIETIGDIYIKSRMAEEYTLKSKDGWDIYVSTNFSLKKATDMLKLFFEKEITNSEDIKKIEYIDLRIENHTYYRLKKEEDGIDEDDAEKREDKTE